MMCRECGRKLCKGNRSGLCRSCITTERNKKGWSESTRAKLSGENHYGWKGDGAGYIARHDRVSKARGRASEYECCESCGRMAQEWAQRHGTDGTRPEHYMPMCCSCHQKYDNHWNDEARAKVSNSLKRAYAEGRR